MVVNLLTLASQLLFHPLCAMLHVLNLVFLLFNLPFPVALDVHLLFLFVSEHFFKLEELVFELALLNFHLVVVSLELFALILNHSLCLFDLLHIVLHLILEVILQETEQVLLDVNFLNLTVDGVQLAVDLGVFHLAKAAEFTSHFDDLVLLLVEFVLLALLLDLGDDLRLDQVELEVDAQQAPALLHQEREDVSRLLSQGVPAQVDAFQTFDELESLAE